MWKRFLAYMLINLLPLILMIIFILPLTTYPTPFYGSDKDQSYFALHYHMFYVTPILMIEILWVVFVNCVLTEYILDIKTEQKPKEVERKWKKY